MPGNYEILVLLVIGLLIFGRRLPEVGRSVGKTLVQFRSGFNDFKQKLNEDEDLREAKSAVRDIKKAVDAPRVLANPKRFLDTLADDPAAHEVDQSELSPPPAGEPSEPFGPPEKPAD